MRLSIGLAVCLVSLVAGCEPPVQRQQLGTIQGDASEVPGGDQPYELRQLEADSEGAAAGSPSPDGARDDPVDEANSQRDEPAAED